jgi:hypothetical protein
VSPVVRRVASIVTILLLPAALVQADCGGSAVRDGTFERPGCAALGSSPRAKYVSKRGSDSNSGTLRRPWRTIQRALDAAAPGQTVWVRGGVYREDVDAERDGTVAAPITLRTFPRERATISGRVKVAGSNVRVTGFVVTPDPSAGSDDVLVYISGGDNVELRRNEIRGSTASGIYVGDAGDGADCVRIVENWIHGNGTHWNLDHGVYFGYGRGGTVAANVVERNLAYGIHLGPQADKVLVTQNTVVANRRSGVIVAGYDNTTSNGNLIVNNVVAFNEDWGIRTYWEEDEGANNAAQNNLVYGNGRGATYGKGLALSGNVTRNPLFLGTRNYHLRVGSPAIDSADAGYTTNFDRDGHRRPRGSRPDLGAFER